MIELLAELLGMQGMGWKVESAGMAFINLMFAIGVATAGQGERAIGKTVFVPRWVWVFATLVGGVLVAGIYWAMHHSSLRVKGGEQA